MLYKVITYNRKNFDYKKKNKCVLSTKKYLTFSRVSEKRAGKSESSRDGELRPGTASFSDASFFAHRRARNSKDTRVTVDEAQGSMARFLLPAFFCAQIFIEREMPGYEAGPGTS